MASPAVNRAKYARAQEYIRLGLWIVDLERGLIYSARTKAPLRAQHSKGYRTYGITLPGGSRKTARAIPVRAARVIWESVHGPIPDGLEINHKNGDHGDDAIANLELVTNQENIDHSIRTGLKRVARGERARAAKLTEVQVREIRARLVAGESQTSVARRYGVTQGAVSQLHRGRTWAHVPGSD